MKYLNNLFMVLAAVSGLVLQTGCDEEIFLVDTPAVVVAYAGSDSQKVVAYDAADGTERKATAIESYDGSYGGASAMAVYDDRLFIGCGNSKPMLYVFNKRLKRQNKIDIQSWASTSFDNPHSIIIVDDTHGYISMMGQAGFSDGSVIEFNPADMTFTSETTINEDASNSDNPNSLYLYNGDVYCTVYTMDSGWQNQGSYVYNVTADTKFKDLTSINIQTAGGYDKYLYCCGTDAVEVVDLSDNAAAATVVSQSHAGVLAVYNTTGYLLGGWYDAGDFNFVVENAVWTFDASAGTGALTSVTSSWGGGGILGPGSAAGSAMVLVPYDSLRTSPYGDGDSLISSGQLYGSPGAVTPMTLSLPE